MRPTRLVVTIGALVLASPLRAQGAGAVPPGDPAYRAIDRLVSAGLIDTILVGQRPYSPREMARLIAEARRNARRLPRELASPFSGVTLATLEQRFLDASRSLVDAAEFIVITTNAAPRLIPSDSGIGGIDAVVAPLAFTTQSGGRDAMRGTTLAIETWHHLPLGPNAAVDLQPRIRASTASSFVGERAVSLQTAVFSARAGNVGFSMGREHVVLGQGRRGGLLISDNAPPLDGIRVGTDQPWVPPGWFRVVGPSALSLFVADLGSSQYFPHTKLVAYKWSAKPSMQLELGASALDFVGGRGAPGASFGKKVANLFLFPVLPTEGYQFSNTMVGVEARYRPRAFTGAQLYWEMSLDDFDFQRVRSSVWTDDGAHLLGLTLPRLGDAGRTALTLEAHHTGTRFGRHLQFISGATASHFPLGDPLGPAGAGQYAFVDRELGGNRSIALELANEIYRNDQHSITQPPFTIHLTERRPSEHRRRAAVTLRRAPLGRGAAVSIHTGVERIDHFDFANTDTRTGALAGVSLRYSFR